MKKVVKVTKTGTGKSINIPTMFADHLQIEVGTKLQIELKGEKLIISVVKNENKNDKK
ncbi:MAG: hypothetical protein RR795_01475 [Cetobacterium sp.]|uniref:hypothetical protein n=1 Tax=Cetobacterium sp. TaxID=2071632 RepID=UPI002FC69CBE